MKLKIFSDKAYLPANKKHVWTLYPFWGYLKENENDPDNGRFNQYVNHGNEIFEFVESISKCDIAILPAEWHHYGDTDKSLAYKLADLCKHDNKKLVIFFNNDSFEEIPIDNSIIFRTSFYKSQQKSNEFAIPGWSIDFLDKYYKGVPQLREKTETPVIGYCGYVDYEKWSLFDQFKKANKNRKFYPNEILRGKIIRKLIKTKNINFNLIIRDSFGGGNNDWRDSYVNNILGSDYLLAVRGCGNFSYRLYEIMSMGRIPLFINTDCVLPYDNIIDYKKYFLWLEDEDLKSIGSVITNFHSNLSIKDFKDFQIEIRKIYDEWISPFGFHKNLYKLL